MARDRVYFLAKDPHWSFVWWELSAESLGRAAAAAGVTGERRLVLRVHDVTEVAGPQDEGPVVRDVAVTGEADHWYLELPAGRAYRVRLGFRSAGGELHAAGVSNPLSLPPDGPSGRPPETDETWSTVPLARKGWRKKATS